MIDLYFDKKGRPITHQVWAKLFENLSYRIIAKSKIGKVEVSTIWLGLDLSWNGKKSIFETMVFGGKLEGKTERYSTLERALEGHEKMVAQLTRAVKADK